ncbi:Hypothetical predicted protein [Mytilus galloprovincialis]|uniref:DEX1 C-terminal domain-containing protein n=1 Tax=Mytilus galloprovincialis TaxID=29158 RepID=A0A8B6CL33_MYTGA|nr:Hypothetical predicted protein [Mytilus galloprovincialis]
MASGFCHSLYTGMANTGSQHKSQTSVYCDFCESKGMWRCLDCECRPVMCDKCKDNIHSKMAKNHRMERIKEVPYKDVSGSLKFRNIKCEEHEDIDIEHNEIEETLEKLQNACDILGYKPCTTSEGVVFFLENFDRISDSLTEETPTKNTMSSRDILYPHFKPGDFSLLKFGSLEVDKLQILKAKGSNKKEQLNGLKYEDIGKFLLSGITVVNLTTLEPLWTKILDLTQITAEFPAYNLFTPTVVDIQGDFSPLEIVLGTSAGNLYMLGHTGQVIDGWPKSSGSIHGQITVADINGDDIMDIIAIDTSGDVVCYNSDGKTQWEIQITGTSTAGSRLYDVNSDNVLDVIITTNVGDIFALDGMNGQILPNWPVKLGKKISSNVLITKISTAHSTPDMLVLTDDGYLHVISIDLKCKTKFTLGETTLVQLLAHDLVKGSDGLEILVATNDGALICLGSSQETTDIFIDEEKDKEILKFSLQSETKSPNDFIYGSIKKAGPYEIRVYFGFHLLQNTSHAGPGVYSIKVPAFDEPSHGHIIVVMRNKHGLIVTDSYTIRFNRLIMEDLQWLLVTPFIAMLIILLVLHGFPMKDLLPYTHQSKTR